MNTAPMMLRPVTLHSVLTTAMGVPLLSQLADRRAEVLRQGTQPGCRHKCVRCQGRCAECSATQQMVENGVVNGFPGQGGSRGGKANLGIVSTMHQGVPIFVPCPQTLVQAWVSVLIPAG